MPSFSSTEKSIIQTIKNTTNFTYDGKQYIIKKYGKPTTSKGEPKTDIYILAEDKDKNIIEFKISVKQSNADFLENKMKAERAEEIFGSEWKNIISELTQSIMNSFKNKQIIFKEKKGRTEKGAITLGWKFEILNKEGGELSGKLPKHILKEVITGENLSIDKKNAMVNGTVIKDSGIANYILLDAENLDLTNLNTIMNSIDTTENYINSTQSNVYFACKALNYRTMYIPQGGTIFVPKWDGNRPLAVYVKWKNDNNKLNYDLCFDNPLTIKGDEVAKILKNTLNVLNIKTTDDI